MKNVQFNVLVLYENLNMNFHNMLVLVHGHLKVIYIGEIIDLNILTRYCLFVSSLYEYTFQFKEVSSHILMWPDESLRLKSFRSTPNRCNECRSLAFKTNISLLKKWGPKVAKSCLSTFYGITYSVFFLN